LLLTRLAPVFDITGKWPDSGGFVGVDNERRTPKRDD
jgi:hypothetical protein